MPTATAGSRDPPGGPIAAAQSASAPFHSTQSSVSSAMPQARRALAILGAAWPESFLILRFDQGFQSWT